MSKLSSAWAVILAVAVVGCNQGAKKEEVAKTDQKPATPAVLKLSFEDKGTGKGPAAAAGDLLAVRYTGKLGDGTEFDSNVKGIPFHVFLGAGEVIPGWDQGLVGLKVGVKRHLSIPWNLAYGDQASGKIPPKSDLFFDVELLGLIKSEDVSTVIVLKDQKGSGPAAKVGDKVTVKFVGKILDGTKFDSSDEYGGKYTFKVGSNTVVTGFSAGVVGMQKGGKRTFRLPPAIGRNEMAMVAIPDKSIIDFEVELISIG